MMRTITLFFFLMTGLFLHAQEKTKVACVGNSITYGYLLPDREKNAYPSQLQNLLGENYRVGNFGKSGATLLAKGHRPYIKQQEYKEALAFGANIIIIHLGLNDTDPRNWVNYRDDFFKNYVDLIDSFRKQNSEVEIWICRMSSITHKHPRFISGTRDWYGQIQEAIEQVANYTKVGLIDLEKSLYQRPDLLPDALHPNVEGAKIVAQTVYSALTGNYGGLQMPAIYSDNMILQRDEYLTIKGVANVNEEIQVKIASQNYKAITSPNGEWQVILNPLKTGEIYTIEISSPNIKLTYKNVAVGEVWLCSGQSNMAFGLYQSADYKSSNDNYDNPNIRLFNMQARWDTNATEWEATTLDSINQLQYYSTKAWEECSEKSAADFSAVAYYFGKMLSDSLNVPIGLILNAVGGSATESWIDRKTLEYEFPAILSNWTHNDLIQDWVRGRALLNTKKAENKEQRHPYEPSYLFEAGIDPLSQYPIKGVIWYQGESNAHNIETHEKLFPLLVESWRENWQTAQLPFFYVQLSSLNRPSWTWFRDSQRQLMDKVPNTYMAVSSDRGDSLDVHPRYKKDVGERLALLALNKSYGKMNIIPSGPLYKAAELVGQDVYISFQYGEGLKTRDNEELQGFEIAEIDGLYYPAQTSIVNDKIKLWANEVKTPHYVRYGWQAFTCANLENRANLPASTFKTEQQQHNNMKDNSTCTTLPNYPIEGGVSAPFVGIHNNRLIVAGGCNFPNKPALEGGEKSFYKDVYFLNIDEEGSAWRKGGNLPQATAYGSYVVVDDGIICLGGQGEKGAIKDVVHLSFDEQMQEVKTKKMTSLPVALFNADATLVNQVIYIMGGSSNGKVNTLYALNLNDEKSGWLQLETNLANERQQPVLFSQNGDLFLGGGYDEKNAEAYTDILKFAFSTKTWNHFCDIQLNGNNRTFVGTACASSSTQTLFVGGVDYQIFTDALQRIQRKQKAIASKDEQLIEEFNKAGTQYMSQEPEWYKFSTNLISFDGKTKSWEVVGNHKQLARAGAGIAINGKDVYVICGELKPGIRTEQINKITLK